jgi:hypothetical protein
MPGAKPVTGIIKALVGAVAFGVGTLLLFLFRPPLFLAGLALMTRVSVAAALFVTLIPGAVVRVPAGIVF